MKRLLLLVILFVFSASVFAQDSQIGAGVTYSTTKTPIVSNRENSVGLVGLLVKRFENDIKIINTFTSDKDQSFFYSRGANLGNNLNVRVPVPVNFSLLSLNVKPYVQGGVDFQKQFLNGASRSNFGPQFGAGVEVGKGFYADYKFLTSPNTKSSLRQHEFGPEYYFDYKKDSKVGLFSFAKYTTGNFEGAPGSPVNTNGFKIGLGASKRY